jgi:hypothetical protein
VIMLLGLIQFDPFPFIFEWPALSVRKINQLDRVEVCQNTHFADRMLSYRRVPHRIPTMSTHIRSTLINI